MGMRAMVCIGCGIRFVEDTKLWREPNAADHRGICRECSVRNVEETYTSLAVAKNRLRQGILCGYPDEQIWVDREAGIRTTRNWMPIEEVVVEVSMTLAMRLFRTDPRVQAIVARCNDGRSAEFLFERAWQIETALRAECEARAAAMNALR